MSLTWRDVNALIGGFYDWLKLLLVQYKQAAAADANEDGDNISIFTKSKLEISMMYKYLIEVPKE